jgi:hypothetical protein
LSGCITTGAFHSANLTNVTLEDDNFTVVARDVAGEAQAGYLLGLSYGVGSAMQTLALVRVEGEGLLYKEAIENLWNNFEENYGPVEGRKLALVNVRYDTDAMNILLLYTQPRVSIRADVVEFGGEE